MSASLAVLLLAGVQIACGIYLMLERTLTRIILGFVLAGNGVNLLFVVAIGPPGLAPFEGTADPEEMSDPLPFALVLTALVITMGVTAFVMALSYRAWQLFGHDEVPDDVEDRRVLRRSQRRAGVDIDLPWAEGLSEEYRRGALIRSQGLSDYDDPLGPDISAPEDVPQDYTEADEGQDPSGQTGRARATPGPHGGQGRRRADRPRGSEDRRRGDRRPEDRPRPEDRSRPEDNRRDDEESR